MFLKKPEFSTVCFFFEYLEDGRRLPLCCVKTYSRPFKNVGFRGETNIANRPGGGASARLC